MRGSAVGIGERRLADIARYILGDHHTVADDTGHDLAARGDLTDSR